MIERAEPLPLFRKDISISHQAPLNDGVYWVADISINGNLNPAEILGTSSLDLSFENTCLFSDLTEEPVTLFRLTLRILRLVPKSVKETLSATILQRIGEFILAYFSSSTSS